MSEVVRRPTNMGVFIPYADPPGLSLKAVVAKHKIALRSAVSPDVLAAILPVPKSFRIVGHLPGSPRKGK